MKKIKKEDFAILNESEMNEVNGGINVEKSLPICNHMEFACCYYNYKVDFPDPVILRP
ncbi:hypothetical protein SAMN05216354_0846 [Xylanibacter ruminicola]|jgi:hypothetical protein|uniref:Uncharacterized protein n=1 Tax=Xylanibacter ruminicola TaxID=839 RepID=A0A1H5T599_XYLRU|nr:MULTISPECIES: hypothetical protein [Prevotellaceae]MCR5470931.1 hypothetical protein [Prevotella sp.]SEF57328.1 hypothetical protein SAMN05216354_0846 [Xylanibacter ruminicola]SEV97260.1 hypothetical protein SAMN04487827_0999 [Prevotella sp. khp7]